MILIPALSPNWYEDELYPWATGRRLPKALAHDDQIVLHAIQHRDARQVAPALDATAYNTAGEHYARSSGV